MDGWCKHIYSFVDFPLTAGQIFHLSLLEIILHKLEIIQFGNNAKLEIVFNAKLREFSPCFAIFEWGRKAWWGNPSVPRIDFVTVLLPSLPRIKCKASIFFILDWDQYWALNHFQTWIRIQNFLILIMTPQCFFILNWDSVSSLYTVLVSISGSGSILIYRIWSIPCYF